MKIDHINIVVSNLEETKKFFMDLGMQEVDGGNLEGDWVSKIVNLTEVKAEYTALKFPKDTVKLELLKYHTPESKIDENIGVSNQIGFRHIAFKVDNIEKIVENFKTKSIHIFSEIQAYPKTGKKLIYFYGPDNIILELAEYPKLT